MKLSRDLDAMRFVGECTTREGFVPDDIQCLLCTRRMDPEVQNPHVSLMCSGCGNRARRFNSETEMNLSSLSAGSSCGRSAGTHRAASSNGADSSHSGTGPQEHSCACALVKSTEANPASL